MSYKLISTLILIGMMVIFVIQNVTVVEIKFFLWSFEMSRALLYFILIAKGIIIGWLLNNYYRNKKQLK